MLAKLILTLEHTAEKQVTVNMSSVFQGMLMEVLDEETCVWLHRQQRHPYSQFLRYEGNKIYWTISTVTKEAYERIILPMQREEVQHLESHHHEMIFEIRKREIFIMEEQEFLENHYFKDFARIFQIEFLTPISFKSDGQYQNYPTIKWIFQSLMNKYDSRGADRIFDEELLQMITEQTSIIQYKLRSTYFHLEGTKIPAFLGTVKIYTKCSQSVVNLMNLLLKYGEFSGVGIKSAIGMGAVRIESRERKEQL